MANLSLLFPCLFIALGTVSGLILDEEPKFYELRKGNVSVKFTNWGARIASVIVPDKDEKLADIVLGYDSVKEYMNDKYYLGAIVGRVSNRTRGTPRYKLEDANEGKNTLHGDFKEFSNHPWHVMEYQQCGRVPRIKFAYSNCGEEGFPGEVLVTVTYLLDGDSQLTVTMMGGALNKEDSLPINLVQHTYWNLGGHDSGSILNNYLQVHGSQMMPLCKNLILTGEIVSVERTLYDFLRPHRIGSKMEKRRQLRRHGYDVNYVVQGNWGTMMKPAAVVSDHWSGRVLEVLSNAPVMEFETANNLECVKGKCGYGYGRYAGLSLLTQGYPDDFPAEIISREGNYEQFLRFKFLVRA